MYFNIFYEISNFRLAENYCDFSREKEDHSNILFLCFLHFSLSLFFSLLNLRFTFRGNSGNYRCRSICISANSMENEFEKEVQWRGGYSSWMQRSLRWASLEILEALLHVRTTSGGWITTSVSGVASSGAVGIAVTSRWQ